MNSSLKRQLVKTFTQMVDDLSNPAEIETFFADFFSEAEFDVYVKRISIAYWLKKGRDEDNIKRNLGASAKEIAQAKKILKTEGVRLALKKIEAEEWANVWAEKIKSFAKK